MDPVARRRLRRPRLRAERGDPHPPHQPLNPLAVDDTALVPQQRRHPPRAQERVRREQLVEPPHQPRLAVVVRRRPSPVNPGARQPQQHALPPHRQRLVRPVEHRRTVRPAHRPDLRAKKSRSTVSRPIFA